MSRTPLVGEVGPGRDVVPLPVLVDQWVAAGLISPDQAQALTASSEPASAEAPPRVRPALAEALAYVGGAIVAGGASLLVAYYWGDLTSGRRLLVLASAAAALLGLGAAVPGRLGAAGRRMRAALWVAATAVFAAAVAVLVGDVVAAERFSAAEEPVLVAGATVVLAALLWALLPYGLQQTAVLVALAALAGTAFAWWDGALEPGVGVWLVGAVWAALGLAGWITPSETPLVLGAAAAILGAMTTGGSDAGMVFALVTILAVVGLAALRRDLPLLGLGAAATVINVPMAVSRWFAGSVAAAVALVVVGLLLVAVAVWMTRGRAVPQARDGRRRVPGLTARAHRGGGWR